MMKKEILEKLLEINDRFYRDFGKSFAETRRRIQPGVEKILNEYIRDGNWLDLGCGSGALGSRWIENGITGLYEGLDFSPVLIGEAQEMVKALTLRSDQKILYTSADLGQQTWVEKCSRNKYDGILMFAALHHLPGAEQRNALLRQISDLLDAGSFFIHSEWQFQRSKKLKTRIQPWSLVGIDLEDLEPGDTLLDWRHPSPGQGDSNGLRYVHLFTHDELSDLAQRNGFKIVSEFDSDGKEGNLSLYQVWKKQ